MQNSKSSSLFYGSAALVLLLAGLALFLISPLWLHLLYDPGRITEPALALARLAGAGLILAAGLNLLCLLRPESARPLHAMVLVFLVLAAAGMTLVVRDQGLPLALNEHWWLWALPLVYALPLIPLRMPRKLTGEEHGEVKWFNPRKGFGFIVADDEREVFVHFRALQNGGRQSLRPGTRVRFRTRETDRGEQAQDVYIEG